MSDATTNERLQGLRRRWLGVLARAQPAELEAAWQEHGPQVPYTYLRRPETGMVMVRGRAGGDGQPFNLGEATVTRCSVRTDAGHVGTAYVLGTGHRQAELAALVDALLQDGRRRRQLLKGIIAPLLVARHQRRKLEAARAAATKVDFFTLVRGE